MEKQKEEPRTCKIFVGGLPSDTTEREFRDYFKDYGDISDLVVMKDRSTKKGRGFGFVTFYNETAADRVMVDKKHHKLKGKWIDCKRAVPKSELKGGEETNSVVLDTQKDEKQPAIVENKGDSSTRDQEEEGEDGLTFRELR